MRNYLLNTKKAEEGAFKVLTNVYNLLILPSKINLNIAKEIVMASVLSFFLFSPILLVYGHPACSNQTGLLANIGSSCMVSLCEIKKMTIHKYQRVH
jgi:hypothetical protein